MAEPESWSTALAQACDPVLHLCWADITDGHAVAGAKDGRALRADGRDVQALIVSSRFEGMSPIERQRHVNAVLDAHLVSGKLHSLQLRCWTPAQWERLGKPANLGKPCTQLNVPEASGAGGSLELPPCRAPADAPAAAAAASAPPAEASGSAPPEELTVGTVVEHLLSQGAERGLASARAILSCGRASEVARRAATDFVEQARASPAMDLGLG
jgi:acid stress-induced BolA-like protein IbaG/YrbA